jgi:hypothetical protein
MELHERIIAYVQKHHPLRLSSLEGVVLSKGFTITDLYTALEAVHRDKRITRKVQKGEIVYSPAVERTATVGSHVAWLTANYPRPHQCPHGVPYTTCEHCMPFPEITYAGLFLKTKEERDAYLAEAKGMPVHMVSKKRYGNAGR